MIFIRRLWQWCCHTCHIFFYRFTINTLPFRAYSDISHPKRADVDERRFWHGYIDSEVRLHVNVQSNGLKISINTFYTAAFSWFCLTFFAVWTFYCSETTVNCWSVLCCYWRDKTILIENNFFHIQFFIYTCKLLAAFFKMFLWQFKEATSTIKSSTAAVYRYSYMLHILCEHFKKKILEEMLKGIIH